ncbi:ETS-related transcription factor Elf-3-like isoform X1 [Mytilus californianus]|uniref:ETS-related transcription factor Elf-3-like isoform X1 n=1 Tax=Mytilus californianus TaxID=6549 RepID=UPI00224819AF|nr:ETS-related transcription factor Elf-3-like isoform X1 [Mytilus californianus]
MFDRGNFRSDLFNGIMASTVFPSLADVFTEAILTEDIFQSLDQVSSRAMSETMESVKGLNENDFLNQHVLSEEKAEVIIAGAVDSSIQELTQPDDLMIPLMWPNVYGDQGGETLVVEYEIEVPPEETGEMIYANSPGSAGDISDFSSEPENDSSCGGSDGSSPMISYNKVEVKTEPGLDEQRQAAPYLPVQAILSPYEEEELEDYNDTVIRHKKRRKSDAEYIADGRKRPGRKKGQTSSVYHLWEFIRDLLHDPKQRIIKWENEQEGIFRVVKSSEVAKQWGNMKKNREKMTYEKLSRSLRYSRKEGYFEDVPKDEGYPKKLCFKFGPKSHGWKRL